MYTIQNKAIGHDILITEIRLNLTLCIPKALADPVLVDPNGLVPASPKPLAELVPVDPNGLFPTVPKSLADPVLVDPKGLEDVFEVENSDAEPKINNNKHFY
jgi:hypothetical protein